MGAWIEIEPWMTCQYQSPSHPTWVRGLKLSQMRVLSTAHLVAPHMGAWIEIALAEISFMIGNVAPHMGAWIEIFWC